MTTVKWHEGRMVGFDLETTGISVFEDRIVTAAIVHHAPGQRPRALTWVINPGIPIPTEASDVHGWTTERLTQHLGTREAVRITNGSDTQPLSREAALFEIAAQCATTMAAEAPLVAANASYDLSLLETELVRHGIDPLTSRPSGIRGVVDPMVIEKQFDPFRKVKGGCRGGKVKCGGCGAENKTLTGLAAHYRVVLAGAHDASADALAALRLVPRLAAAWPEIARWKLGTLHTHQVTWRAEQSASLRAYFDKQRPPIEHDGVCGEWPVHSACAPAFVGGAS